MKNAQKIENIVQSTKTMHNGCAKKLLDAQKTTKFVQRN